MRTTQAAQGSAVAIPLSPEAARILRLLERQPAPEPSLRESVAQWGRTRRANEARIAPLVARLKRERGLL